MTAETIKSAADRDRPRLSEALAGSADSPSEPVHAVSDFDAVMAGFAAAIIVEQGNVPEPYRVGDFSVAWHRNRGLWYVLDSAGNVRSWDEAQADAERRALAATERLTRGEADCPVCEQPMAPGAGVVKPGPQGPVRCAPADAGARHDHCIGQPTLQFGHRQQDSSAPHLDRRQVLAWIRKHGLAYANLQDVDLHDADVRDADLTGADLRNGHLDRARLDYAHLTGANFTSANFGNANLENTDLSGADLNEEWLDREVKLLLETMRD